MSKEILQKHFWINNSFFEKILKRESGDSTVFVKTFEIAGIAGREQNYWCDVFKVVVNYVNSSNVARSDNFILKVGFYDPYMKQELEKYNTLKRELAFYCDIMPNIEELMQSNDDLTKLVTKALSLADMRPQPKYLLLEDPRYHGYELISRKIGFNLIQLKFLLKKLAKFHAVTAVLHTTMEENLMKNHNQPNVSENFRSFHSIFLNCLHACASAVQEWSDCESYANKLQILEKTLIEKSSEAFVQDALAFGVLNHGDLTTHNVMYRLDNELNPVDVLISNFELSFFGSPGIDLAFLLFTNSSKDIKDYEFDILLQIYHKNLHENLIKFGYKREIPSLTDIHNEFLKCGIIGVMYSLLLIPLRFVDSSKDLDLTVIANDSRESRETRKQMFQVPEIKERLLFLLDYFDRKGFLD